MENKVICQFYALTKNFVMTVLSSAFIIIFGKTTTPHGRELANTSV